MGNKLKYTEEHIDEIKAMLFEKRPIHEIARKIGIKYVTLIRHLRKLNVPYETNPRREGIPHNEVRKNSWYYLGTEHYIASQVLKKKLIEDGIKEYKCECCGGTKWNGEPIPLELHHKNGDHSDNRLDNLEILCSNCHSQKHSYCKNIQKKEKKSVTNKKITPVAKKYIKNGDYKIVSNTCPVCGKTFSAPQKNRYCSQKCWHIASERCKNGMSKDSLIKAFKEFGNFASVGRFFGISDNAIRKWCKKYGIPSSSKNMKEYIAEME